MLRRILITGGAGFIGSHLADELLSCGCSVRVLDNLCSQVHGERRAVPGYLSGEVEFLSGDVENPADVAKALTGIEAVFHFAARVGVGQSMYAIRDYTASNAMGTATLMEALSNNPVQKLVVASSMSIYGEGLYQMPDGRATEVRERPFAQLRRGEWELQTPAGQPLRPLPTPETKTPALASVYALSKYSQEQMCLMLGAAYGIEAVALHFFNVYGPRQSLSNPYTGVLAIFASRLLNNNPPLIFEDGLQQRDLVSVYDVAQACRRALEISGLGGEVFNIGSGRSYTVKDIAHHLRRVLGKTHIEPQITNAYRRGDIRHCVADITRARERLGYEPAIPIEDGLKDVSSWLEGQVANDRVEQAAAELSERGLMV
jgi:dTDP-L-rhamnose 4-epimerase